MRQLLADGLTLCTCSASASTLVPVLGTFTSFSWLSNRWSLREVLFMATQVRQTDYEFVPSRSILNALTTKKAHNIKHDHPTNLPISALALLLNCMGQTISQR